MDSLFESGLVSRVSSTGGDYYSFLDYTTYSHQLISEDSGEVMNRLGIILSAKSTKSYTLTATATMGDGEGDTCKVNYIAIIDVVTNGRSAFVSVANAFSSKENKVIQGDPNSSIEKEGASGIIRMKDQSDSFSYQLEFKSGKLKPTGIFICNGDTLSITAVQETIKKGKVKKAGAISRTPGIQLEKRGVIYAALDILNDKKIIWLANSITKSKKLRIASLFYSLQL